MAERQADRHPDIPNGYHIPVDTQKLASFPHQAHLVVVLNDAHSGYEVYQKDIPNEVVGKTHQGKSIRWLNNFGLKQKGRGEYAAEVPEYLLLLEQIEGAQFVYFDGTQVLPLATTPHSGSSNQLRAALRLGDPPIGWVG